MDASPIPPLNLALTGGAGGSAKGGTQGPVTFDPVTVNLVPPATGGSVTILGVTVSVATLVIISVLSWLFFFRKKKP